MLQASGFQLLETNQLQVNKIISCFKSSKRRDAFQFDTMFVKSHTDIWTHLMNLCFKRSCFPDDGNVSRLFLNVETLKPETTDQ